MSDIPISQLLSQMQDSVSGFGTALQAVITDAEILSNLVTQGWVKFPTMFNGVKTTLILQLGGKSITGTGDDVQFPIQFPTACLRVVACDSGVLAYSVSAAPKDNTAFTAYAKDPGTGAAASASISYLAIGL